MSSSPIADLADTLARNLADVRARVATACARAGRDAASVSLVAVSKTQSIDVVRAAYDAGARDFGENYAQELVDKHAALAGAVDVRWHFVGHVQTNKAKAIAARASLVHAVDSARLARELDKRAAEAGRRLDVLCEVNVGGEASKSGVAPDALGALLDAIEAAPSLRLRGLMSIPPPVDDREDARPFHAQLRALRDAHGGIARLPELSMGMSDDFEIAIEEGATIVRVGTRIFGARAPRSR